MVAEVEEVMLPYTGTTTGTGVKLSGTDAKVIEEGNRIVEEEENVESQEKVSTKTYVVQKNDSLWKIAKEQLGSGYRWKYIYELNKDKIKNPDKLKAVITIFIPVE